jgi:hypothetical protein
VDFVDGGPVERSAPAIGPQKYGPRSPAALDAGRDAGAGGARLPGPTPGTGADAVGRGLCRRHLRPGQTGGPKVGNPKRGKGPKLMGRVDGAGTPLGLPVAAASPAEVPLLEATSATVHVPRAHRAGRPRHRPNRLSADRGYDSNAVRAALDLRGIPPSFPPALTTVGPRLRMAAACAALVAAGSWHAPPRGRTTSGAWSCAMNARLRFTRPWCIWLVPSLHSKGFSDDF